MFYISLLGEKMKIGKRNFSDPKEADITDGKIFNFPRLFCSLLFVPDEWTSVKVTELYGVEIVCSLLVSCRIGLII